MPDSLQVRPLSQLFSRTLLCMIPMTISKPEMTSNAKFFKRIHPFMKRVILSISKLRAKFSWSNMSYFMFAICLLILKVNWHIYVLSVRASRYLFISMAMFAGIISYQRAYSRLKWKLIKNNKSKRPLRCRLRKTLNTDQLSGDYWKIISGEYGCII